MANPYAPPAIDFSPLANLGETFFNARDKAIERQWKTAQLEAPSEWAAIQAGAPSATVPQTMPLASLGQGAAPTFAAGGAGRSMAMPADPALAPAIKKYAAEAGLDPVDVATAMSYETAGTFDPWKAGPTTKWGQHRGLIQWGEPQAAQYGVSRDTPVDQQVAASIKYLRDRGVKPGMGLMDIYSAINAGSVGRYNASDAAAGGAPGTVADKVNNQMSGHREKAMALLGISPADVPGPNAQPAQGFAIPGSEQPAPAGVTPPQIQPPAYVQRALQHPNPFVRAKAAEMAQEYQKLQQQYALKAWEHGLDQRNKDRTYGLDREKFDFEKGKKPTSVQEFEYGQDNPEYFDRQLALKKAGATVVDASQKGENKFEETLGAKQADRWNGYIAAADEAQTRKADIDQMRELSRRIGSQGSTANGKLLFGPYLEAAGVNVEGLSDLQVYDSLVKRLAPQMRAPGSGSTSDVEYKGFIAAIGPLSNHPSAREAILDTFEAAARNDLARGEIATRLAAGEISRGQAERELRALPSPLQAFREFRKSNPDLVGQAIKEGRVTGSKPNPAPTGAPKPGEVQDGYRFKGGNPSDPASWEKVQ